MNAYLHIPFCTSICSYCDFTSFAGQESKMSRYLDALVMEVEKSTLTGPLQTVYFGGGTPSLVPPNQLGKVLEALGQRAGWDPEAEISMEANPETVELKKLEGYRSFGINRLSFGAQAFQKEILKKLGRGHEWDRVEQAFRHARQAGFQNINLDLMFGLPGQTIAMFQASVEQALSLSPDHLSLYALQVEEGTPLHRQVRDGLTLPSEDETADEYAWAQSALARAGFEQYEVSNFAREGKSCRHNWSIWRGEDYWGFGVSAVGTVKGIRHSHGEDLGDYIQTTLRGQGPVLQEEVLSASVRTLEKLMLNFRTRDGVLQNEVEGYARKMGLSYENRFARLQKEGFLSLSEGRYRVTSKGYFVLNGILESLVA